jgi:acyl-ACP thioesterase
MSGEIADEFVDPVSGGRVYRVVRHVHLGDVDGTGELRLEALARFLQDVATDDAYDVGLADQIGGTWVLRRMAIEIDAVPMFNDDIEVATFCSGWGPAWAERRTDVFGSDGALLARTVAIWVFIDRAGGRPLNFGDEFFAIYGSSAKDRRVSSRLRHPKPSPSASVRPWQLRESDFDLLDHVNNARYLEAVEDELAIRLPKHKPLRAELEFRGAVERGDRIDLVTELTEMDLNESGQAGARQAEAELAVWLVSEGEVRMSARLETRVTHDATRANPAP